MRAVQASTKLLIVFSLSDRRVSSIQISFHQFFDTSIMADEQHTDHVDVLLVGAGFGSFTLLHKSVSFESSL